MDVHGLLLLTSRQPVFQMQQRSQTTTCKSNLTCKVSKGLSCNRSQTKWLTLEVRERKAFLDTKTRLCGTICSRKILTFAEIERRLKEKTYYTRNWDVYLNLLFNLSQ